jgi:hypothetical protein
MFQALTIHLLTRSSSLSSKINFSNVKIGTNNASFHLLVNPPQPKSDQRFFFGTLNRLQSTLTRPSTKRVFGFSNTERRNIVTNTLIPYVLEPSPHGERAYDIYSRLLKERIVIIHGEVRRIAEIFQFLCSMYCKTYIPQICDSLASVVVAQLLYLESQSTTKPINIYINSPGGGRSYSCFDLALGVK